MMTDHNVTPDTTLTDIRQLYDLGREINRGHFGTVVAARHKGTGAKCALKIIPKSLLVGKAANLAKTEKEIMRRLRHENIVRLHELLNTSTEVIFSMELMQGDLIHYMTAYPKLSMETVATIMLQLLSAVAYLHSVNIVHRDIKADNILLSGSGVPEAPIVKLGDFGLSKIIQPSKDAMTQNTPCGTAWYMAPEIIRAVEASGGIPQTTTNESVKQADMWACGVVMYFLIARKPPFQGQVKEQKDRRAILAKINVGPTFTEARWAGASREAMELCSQLLALDPERRLTAQAALRHPFLNLAIVREEPAPPVPTSSEVDGAEDPAARDGQLADELANLDVLAEEIREAADEGEATLVEPSAPPVVPAAVAARAQMAPCPIDDE